MFCRFTPHPRGHKTPFTGKESSTSPAVVEFLVMIDPKHRFFSEGQGYFGPSENPKTQTHCNVWDWDQLRLIKVKGTAKLIPPQEDVEVSILARFADHLSPEVRAITVDNDGLLTGVSTDPGEDDTSFIGYLPLSICPSLAHCSTIYLSQLQELDRLGGGVDLVSYNDQRVAFKFNPLGMPRRLRMSWKEVNMLSRLPPHPNIVPFDRLVLEDVESRVIGFTTKYIPGGTLADADPKRPFRFEWLQQLAQLVDFLNLESGSCIKILHLETCSSTPKLARFSSSISTGPPMEMITY